MDEKIKNYIYTKKPIGKGSFSYVYYGKNILTDDDVAIKKIINIKQYDKYDDNKKYLENIIDSEIIIMQKLRHPNIVKLYDYIYQDDDIYLIMEYCDKGNLATFLNGKILKEKYAQKMMIQIANAVQYLMLQNIVHRDIKPQNIMVTKDNILKLSDFGFAKKFSNTDDLLTNTICGSPIYMAPEIIQCNSYSTKTDLWSIGIILYEMIVGKPPYRANNHIELLHKINNESIFIPSSILVTDNCRNLIYGLLQKDFNKRISWNNFFEHKWINIENDDQKEIVINLDKLIVDNNYTGIRSVSIPIPKKNTNDNINSYNSSPTYNSSPMFNSLIPLTPTEKNGIAIIKQEEKDINNIDNINTERNINDSLINHMSNALNYLKSYYF